MKSTIFSTHRAIASLLCLLVFASASFAAKKQPLNSPYGLAVDAKGNLYVANAEGGNILVYSPSYIQVTAKTITQGVNGPSAVAFDALGNLWVANYSSNSITEYTNGKQDPNATLTNIQMPLALATDGQGDLWVQNGSNNVSIYMPTSADGPASGLVRTITLPNNIYSVAVGQGTFSWGSNGVTSVVAASSTLISGDYQNGYGIPNSGNALANDANGNLYIGNDDGSVNIMTPQAIEYGFVQLSFVPNGIAVDNAHGRVYFSNFNGNSIDVYSTAGTFLKTIQ
jgi:ligand-binding sensor domain-containing protein